MQTFTKGGGGMTLNQSLIDTMSAKEKSDFEEYCNAFGYDSKSKLAERQWWEFKKSGLTW